MQQRFVVITFLLCSLQALAEPTDYAGYSRGGGSTSSVPVKPTVKAAHIVNSTSVKNEITVENSIKWLPLMQVFPSKKLFKKIESLPGIQNLQFVQGKKEVKDISYDKTAKDVTRSSHVILRMTGPTPLTLMFNVNESIRQCVSAVTAAESNASDYDDDEGVSVSTSAEQGKAPCRAESAIAITGPVAVYGVIPGALTNKMLLQNQIKIDWKISTGFGQKNTEIESSFTALRPDFPQAVQKIINWSQAQPIFTELFMTNPARNTLVQVGRVLKSMNEEILKEQ